MEQNEAKDQVNQNSEKLVVKIGTGEKCQNTRLEFNSKKGTK